MRHHFIPEFLLKRWANTTPDRKVEAFRLDIVGLPSKRYSPRRVGFSDNLYALTRQKVGGFEKQIIETDCLSPIDNSAAKVLQKLLIGGSPYLTEKDRIDWTYFLMSLISRNPVNVEFLNRVAPEKLKAILDAMPEEYDALSKVTDPPTLAEFTEQVRPGLIENFGTLLIKDLVVNPEIGNKILRMNWGLFKFKGHRNHLLLSDSPIIFTEGIDHSDLIIALPISPHVVFMAAKNQRIVNALQSYQQGQLITKLNEYSLNQARKRIFALDRSPHSFISRRMEQWAMNVNDTGTD